MHKRNFDRRGRNDRRQYAVAPYNFIDFPEKWLARYSEIDALPKHDRLDENLLSGSVTLEFEAITPIFVGRNEHHNDEKEMHFFRNQQGYAIPGSTLRGMVRTHAMILGMSNYRDDIEDTHYMYRDMASRNKRLREQYKASIGLLSTKKQIEQQEIRGRLPDKLKAGYIMKKGKTYYIQPAQSDKNGKQIFSISEQKLRNMRLQDRRIQYMYKPETWKNYRPGQKIDLKYKNNEYRPYSIPIQFSLRNDGEIYRIYSESDKPQNGWMKGYLLCSKFIIGRKTHYIIREKDMSEPLQPINQDLVDAYEKDLIRKKFKSSKSRNNPDHMYYYLPEHSEKPVFYVEDPNTGEIKYFGFTPYLRLFYDYSVHDGIPDQFGIGWKLDYNKSIFGFTASKEHNITKSYKSRVSFGDLQAVGNPKPVKPNVLISGEPKASAYPLYLKQPDYMTKGKLNSYNDDSFEIRGIKRYWLKEQIVASNSVKNKHMEVKIHPLPKGTRFKGTIHFTNLHCDELGLLLWSILLEEGSLIQVGMGKPYGFGQMRILRDKLKLEIDQLNKKYSERLTFRSEYISQADPETYITAYKEYINKEYNIDVEKQSHIRQFLAMTQKKLPAEKTRYQQLNEFKWLRSLPTVTEMLWLRE